jgi:hypothetical protein
MQKWKLPYVCAMAALAGFSAAGVASGATSFVLPLGVCIVFFVFVVRG